MNYVEIPLLNSKLMISRVAFNILGIDIYWYAIIIASAFIIALLWCKKNLQKVDINFDDVLNLSIILIPVSIICARIYYVLFNFKYYATYPMEILNFRDGGLAIYGGIIGGVIVCYIYCKKHKINVLDLLDIFSPIFALGQSIGRWGNFVNVEAYGTETNLPWKMGIIENGLTKYVHPTFLYESICTFAIFILLSKMLDKRKFKGEITYKYLLLYSFVRFFIEGLRTDSLMLYNFKISQILSLIIFVCISCILIFKNYKSRNTSKNVEKS